MFMKQFIGTNDILSFIHNFVGKFAVTTLAMLR